MAKQVLCVGGCREWFDAREHWCPSCGWERPRYNGYLHRAKMDNALYRAAESADNERKIEQAMRQGYDAPVSKEIRKKARQVVADM